MNPPRPGVSVRPGGVADRAFIRRIAGEVFAVFGDYETLVSEWLAGPGVRSLVVEEQGERVGFALTCLAHLPSGWQSGGSSGDKVRPGGRLRPFLAVELMALAIAPEHQRRGLGRWLLGVVLERARDLAGSTHLPVVAVTLTVADTNLVARRLFAEHGFRPMRSDGTYPEGQEAWKMAVPLLSRPHMASARPLFKKARA